MLKFLPMMSYFVVVITVIKLIARAVEVIKLIGRGTVEEDMLECANSKLRLEKDITLSGQCT